ncbi:MAG TPA: cell division protein FtsZ [Anaerolineales bacterium]
MTPTSLPFAGNNSLNDIQKPILKVLGLGGGGCNAVERMIELGMSGVDFIAANTDHQVLKNNLAPTKIHLGPKTTRGLGAGGDPRVGQAAAEESCREIAAALQGADMVFLTAGMGGGTGTGSIPVAAEIARSLGAVTIAIVTTPFSFEMGRRQRNATEGLNRLRQQTNTLIAIPNDRLLYIAPRNLPMETAFRLADDVLRQSVQGISELITEPGLINVDFAHIRRLIRLGGGALMAIGQGHGPDKARMALDQALHHPLLDSVSLDRAAGVIANFTGGNDLTLCEVEESLNHLQAQTGAETEIVMGVISNECMNDRVQVILVITGLGAPTLEEALSSVQRPSPAQQPASAPLAEALYPATPGLQAEPFPLSSQARAALAHPPAQPATPAPAAPAASTAAYPPDMAMNLDLPAFLRRRSRLAGGLGA